MNRAPTEGRWGLQRGLRGAGVRHSLRVEDVHRLPGEEGANSLDLRRVGTPEVIAGCIAEVGHKDSVRKRQERRVRWQRLIVIDIQGGSGYLPLAEYVEQRVLLDQRSAGRID